MKHPLPSITHVEQNSSRLLQPSRQHSENIAKRPKFWLRWFIQAISSAWTEFPLWPSVFNPYVSNCVSLFVCKYKCIYVCICTYLHACMHTYMHTYIHAYIHYITLHYIIYITLHYHYHCHCHYHYHCHCHYHYHYITLHCITLHYITLHCIHYIHYIHYIHTLHTYIPLHYITLQYSTAQHITLHYIHTYIPNAVTACARKIQGCCASNLVSFDIRSYFGSWKAGQNSEYL